MNPETRTVLKVSLDDAVEADEIFTVLMGDQVEPAAGLYRKTREGCSEPRHLIKDKKESGYGGRKKLICNE